MTSLIRTLQILSSFMCWTLISLSCVDTSQTFGNNSNFSFSPYLSDVQTLGHLTTHLGH